MKTFTIESIYAAWHAEGIDILGGEWDRFVDRLYAHRHKPFKFGIGVSI